MKAWLVLAGMLAGSQLAAADSRHVLVLHADGNAEAGARTRVDTQVLKLAKNIDGSVEAGDITYADAAVAAGCNITDATCKDEVLATLGVDEIIVTTVGAGASGELKVTVKRVTKGAAPREAATTIPSGQAPDAKMNADIGPLFGVTSIPPQPAVTEAKPPEPKPAEPKPAEPAPTEPKPVEAKPAEPAPPVRTAQVDTVTAAPQNRIDEVPEGADHRRLELTGLAIGGASMALGIVFWAEAANTQSDIDSFGTPRSPKDFQNLTDLENRGDILATIGNVAFIGGVAIAGFSGFMYWRDRRHHGAQHARLVPTMVDHGAGIALSFGGSP
jgi:hypothetical protein